MKLEPDDLVVTSQPSVRTSAWFGILPADERQALRMRRFLMASASSVLVDLLLFAFAWFGALSFEVAPAAAIGIGTLGIAFLVAFRTGANLHSKDPSLTTEQIGAAILVLAFVMYRAPESRGTLTVLYLMPLMFGILRLLTSRLLALSALALVPMPVSSGFRPGKIRISTFDPA